MPASGRALSERVTAYGRGCSTRVRAMIANSRHRPSSAHAELRQPPGVHGVCTGFALAFEGRDPVTWQQAACWACTGA